MVFSIEKRDYQELKDTMVELTNMVLDQNFKTNT